MADTPKPPIFLFDDSGYLYVFEAVSAMDGWLEEFGPGDSCYDTTAQRFLLHIDPTGRVTAERHGTDVFEQELRDHVHRHFRLHQPKTTLTDHPDLETFLHEAAAALDIG